jgi:hypothetical protein
MQLCAETLASTNTKHIVEGNIATCILLGCHHDYTASLTVLDVADGTILLDVHVQSVGHVVLGDHHARLDDSVLLRKVSLAKVLHDGHQLK